MTAVALIAVAAASCPAMGAEPWAAGTVVLGIEGPPGQVPGADVVFAAGGVGYIFVDGYGFGKSLLAPIRAGMLAPAAPFAPFRLREGNLTVRPLGQDRILAVEQTAKVIRAAAGGIGDRLGAPRKVASSARPFQDVATNAKGAIAVAYQNTARNISVTYQPPAGSFSRPVSLGKAQASTSGPNVAMNKKGDVLVAWEGRSDNGSPRASASHSLYTRVRRASGRLGPLQRIAKIATHAHIDVAISGAGKALVGWSDGFDIRYAVGAGRLKPRDLQAKLRYDFENFGNLGLEVAFTPDGRGVLAFEKVSGPPDRPDFTVEAGYLSPDGAVVPQPLSPTADFRLSDLDVGPRGEAMVLWEQGEPSPSGTIPSASIASAPGAPFGSPEQIAPPAEGGLQGAIDPVSGTPYAVWRDKAGAYYYSTRAPTTP